jgi:hypothetical protein
VLSYSSCCLLTPIPLLPTFLCFVISPQNMLVIRFANPLFGAW